MQQEVKSTMVTSDIMKTLKPEIDFGMINGFDKPVLLKSGAEKIRASLGLRIENMDCTNEVFYYGKPYIDVTYKCIIADSGGNKIGICEGSANSEEVNFKYIFQPDGTTPTISEAKKMTDSGVGRWKKYGDKFVWCVKKKNLDLCLGSCNRSPK